MHFVCSSKGINMLSISTLQWPCFAWIRIDLIQGRWIFRYLGQLEADIPLDSTGFMHVSLILFLFPEHLCFPGVCLHNDPLWMSKCTRRPWVRQPHVPRVTEARGRPGKKLSDESIQYISWSSFKSRPTWKWRRVKYQSYDFVLEIGNAFSTWYLPMFCQWMKFACVVFLWLKLTDHCLTSRTKQWKQYSMTCEQMVFHHSLRTRRERTVTVLHMYLSNAPSLADV